MATKMRPSRSPSSCPARWVSELVASAHDAKRAFVTLDGHRSDDDATYALMTSDGGETWVSLTATLPAGAGSARTIAEDPVNEDLLYLGTEFQTFVSLDRGANWTRFNGDLPTVAVHAFAINEPSGEVVAGARPQPLDHVGERAASDDVRGDGEARSLLQAGVGRDLARRDGDRRHQPSLRGRESAGRRALRLPPQGWR